MHVVTVFFIVFSEAWGKHVWDGMGKAELGDQNSSTRWSWENVQAKFQCWCNRKALENFSLLLVNHHWPSGGATLHINRKTCFLQWPSSLLYISSRRECLQLLQGNISYHINPRIMFVKFNFIQSISLRFCFRGYVVLIWAGIGFDIVGGYTSWKSEISESMREREQAFRKIYTNPD